MIDLLVTKLCSIQGRLFELSVDMGFESNNFIECYMNSIVSAKFNSSYDKMQWMGEEYLLNELIDEGKLYKGETYSKDVMFWIGYIYCFWYFETLDKCVDIVRQAPPKVMAQNYAGLHTIDMRLAIQNLIMQYYETHNKKNKFSEEVIKKVLKSRLNNSNNINESQKYSNELKVDIAFSLANAACRELYNLNLIKVKQQHYYRQCKTHIEYLLSLIDVSNWPIKEKAEVSFVLQDIYRKTNGNLSYSHIQFLDKIETQLKNIQ